MENEIDPIGYNDQPPVLPQKGKNILFAIVSYFALFMVLVVFGALIFNKIPIANTERDIFMIIVGAVISNWKDVHTYFFNTTKTSRDKDEFIQSTIKKQHTIKP